MVTQKDGRIYCDEDIGGHPCGGLMRYRRKTRDYACTVCPATVPLSEMTPLAPKNAEAGAGASSD